MLTMAYEHMMNHDLDVKYFIEFIESKTIVRDAIHDYIFLMYQDMNQFAIIDVYNMLQMVYNEEKGFPLEKGLYE